MRSNSRLQTVERTKTRSIRSRNTLRRNALVRGVVGNMRTMTPRRWIFLSPLSRWASNTNGMRGEKLDSTSEHVTPEATFAFLTFTIAMRYIWPCLGNRLDDVKRHGTPPPPVFEIGVGRGRDTPRSMAKASEIRR